MSHLSPPWGRGMVLPPRPCLSTSLSNRTFITFCIILLASGAPEIIRTGLTSPWRSPLFPFGSSAWMWPSALLCVIFPPMTLSASGSTWPALAVLSWSWAARPVRLQLPAGMAALGCPTAPPVPCAPLGGFGGSGLPDLSKIEIEQVALGNALLRTVILFLAAARVYGFAAIMEHPQLPSWAPGAPSSWKLQELVSLSRAGGTADVHLDQCCCGTPWKKPTRLFAVGVPELARLVSVLPGGGRCSRALRACACPPVWQGGRWRLAQCARQDSQYSAMCKLLADATFGCIGRFLPWHADVMAEERGLPADIEVLHVPLDHYDPLSWLAWTHDCARAPH